jgi:hypothetical protein
MEVAARELLPWDAISETTSFMARRAPPSWGGMSSTQLVVTLVTSTGPDVRNAAIILKFRWIQEISPVSK